MPMRSRDLCTAAFLDDVQRMKQLIRAALPPVDEDEEEEEELAALANGGDEEDEEDEPDEEHLFIRRLERRQRRRGEVAALLSKPGLLVAPENGDMCGFLFRVVECSNGALRPVFKASRRSTYPASPLQWAVIGRSYKALAFLIASGVDVAQEVPNFRGVTAATVCENNASYETARRLAKALADYKHVLEKEEDQRKQWLDALEAKRLAREKRAALDAQAAKEEEEQEEEDENEEGMEERDDSNEDDDAELEREGGDDNDDGDEEEEEQ